MTPLKALCALPALAAALSMATPADALFGLGKRETAPVLGPPASYDGQWYTTPEGCSYSRAKAPGYAPTWHLILNPHHIGQPNATARCPAMLTSRS